MSSILVTGGLGVLGKGLVSKLRSKGHVVSICDQAHHHDPNYIRCDVSHFRQVESVFAKAKFDYVYHLAAEFGRWNGEDFYERLWLTNVVGTKNIIRWQERLGFRLIQFSSSEVYGDFDGVMSEEVMDRVEIKQMNDYAMTKWVNEQQVLNSATLRGTQTVRVRIFNTYGPGEYYSPYRSSLCRFAYCALKNLPYVVYTHHSRTYTYIDDATEWLSRICENFKAGEVYNVAGSNRVQNKAVSDAILAYLGKSDSIVEYRDVEPLTTKDKIVDNSKLIRDFGKISETSLALGISQLIEWMKVAYHDHTENFKPISLHP